MTKYITFILAFLTLNACGQNKEKVKLEQFNLSYQLSYSSIPEFYHIKLKDTIVEYGYGNTSIPPKNIDIEIIEFDKEKWSKLTDLISKIDIDSLKHSAKINQNEPRFSLNMFYSKGDSRKFKIQINDAPKNLSDLLLLLRTEK